MVSSGREVCGSARMEKDSKERWDNKGKAAVERKEAVQNDVLGVKNEIIKERSMEICKEEKRRVKICTQSKKEANEQFESKVNQGVNRDKELF